MYLLFIGKCIILIYHVSLLYSHNNPERPAPLVKAELQRAEMLQPDIVIRFPQMLHIINGDLVRGMQYVGD